MRRTIQSTEIETSDDRAAPDSRGFFVAFALDYVHLTVVRAPPYSLRYRRDPGRHAFDANSHCRFA
jgi:hypothetical protein